LRRASLILGGWVGKLAAPAPEAHRERIGWMGWLLWVDVGGRAGARQSKSIKAETHPEQDKVLNTDYFISQLISSLRGLIFLKSIIENFINN